MVQELLGQPPEAIRDGEMSAEEGIGVASFFLDLGT